MAASLTETRESFGGPTPITRINLAWVSASDGTVSIATKVINGTLLRATFNPGATAPTDSYDVTLTDADGVDVLAGQGADLDTANSSHVTPGVPFTDGTTTSIVPCVVSGPLTLNVSNAGDSKEGSVILYVR